MFRTRGQLLTHTTLLSNLRQIVWPERWSNDATNDHEILLLTVDGVHCSVNEPKHPTLSKNPAWYSHKFHQSAVDYEIGISIYTQQVVWISGPHRAGANDISIYRKNGGLKEKIPRGKRAIGDNGYRGEAATISTPNSNDIPSLRKFKGRARARQETFNSRIKTFACLVKKFRHGLVRQKQVFEAVCVICQYQMENGSPLFDV
jgi:hypothetical protein